MAQFIVACEEYERFGGGQIEVDLHEAKDINELIQTLEDMNDDDFGDGEHYTSPLEWLAAANGDGMNFYIIKELKDGKLSGDLIEAANLAS
jgi:hypothetical protein